MAEPEKLKKLPPYDDLRDDLEADNYPLNTPENPQKIKRVPKSEQNKHVEFPYDPTIHDFERPQDTIFMPDEPVKGDKIRRTDMLTRLGIKIFVLGGIYLLAESIGLNPWVTLLMFVCFFMALFITPMADRHPEAFPKFLIVVSIVLACLGYSSSINLKFEDTTLPTNKFCDDDPDAKNCIKIKQQ